MRLATVSILITLIGIAVSVVVALNAKGLGVIGVIIFAPIIVSLIGVIFAIASLIKRERPRWLSILVLVISLAPAAMLASLIVLKKYEDYQNRSSQMRLPPSAQLSLRPPPALVAHGPRLPAWRVFS